MHICNNGVMLRLAYYNGVMRGRLGPHWVHCHYPLSCTDRGGILFMPWINMPLMPTLCSSWLASMRHEATVSQDLMQAFRSAKCFVGQTSLEQKPNTLWWRWISGDCDALVEVHSYRMFNCPSSTFKLPKLCLDQDPFLVLVARFPFPSLETAVFYARQACNDNYV